MTIIEYWPLLVNYNPLMIDSHFVIQCAKQRAKRDISSIHSLF